MTVLEKLLQQSASLHRHLCPRQILGVRIGLLAGKRFGFDLPQKNKRLFSFMETDGCASDGVSVASGCWVGRRTMQIMDYGKVAATFVDTKTGEAVRIHPRPFIRREAATLFPNARSRWHAQLEAYQVLPDDQLLTSQHVLVQVDMESLISRTGVRATCQVCGEEIINEREIIHEGSVLCRACAGESYYEYMSEKIIHIKNRMRHSN